MYKRKESYAEARRRIFSGNPDEAEPRACTTYDEDELGEPSNPRGVDASRKRVDAAPVEFSSSGGSTPANKLCSLNFSYMFVPSLSR